MSSNYKHPSFNSSQASEAYKLCSEGSYRLLDFEWRFAGTAVAI
jgi:hypothetical protein